MAKPVYVAVEKEVSEKVKQYVFANYKSFKDKNLIIESTDSLFKVRRDKDGSPLFLGKGILG